LSGSIEKIEEIERFFAEAQKMVIESITVPNEHTQALQKAVIKTKQSLKLHKATMTRMLVILGYEPAQLRAVSAEELTQLENAAETHHQELSENIVALMNLVQHQLDGLYRKREDQRAAAEGQ
jgi:hypothetical protein